MKQLVEVAPSDHLSQSVEKGFNGLAEISLVSPFQ